MRKKTKTKTKTKKWKRRPYSHGFTMADGKRYVPCTDATHKLRMWLTRKDVERGIPGIACSCAISEAGDRATGWPHPAYWVETCRYFLYVVDKRNAKGEWVHCRKYRHNATEWIDKFDVPGGKAEVLAQMNANKEIGRYVLLQPPAKRKPQTGSGVKEGNYDGSRVKPIGGHHRPPHSTHPTTDALETRGAKRRMRNAIKRVATTAVTT